MKTIEFKISSIKNPQIHQDGYVEVPSDENEMPEWFYYNQTGMAQPREFTHHDGIGITQIGATDEQLAELDAFDLAIHRDFVDWVNEVILLSRESDNRTYRKGDIVIKINEGAKLDINVCNHSTEEGWDSDYYLGFRLHFNGKLVELDEDVYFEDPYTYDEIKVSDILKLSNNLYVVEVPKDYFEADWDDPYRREVIDEYKEAFEKVYRETLVREVGVFGIASSLLKDKLMKENDKRIFDECYIQDFGNAWEDDFLEDDLVTLYYLTDDDVEKAVIDAWEDE